MDYQETTEIELIKFVCEGDSLAFEEIERRNREKIFKWLLGLTKNEHDAEDIYQQALLKSWQNIKKFQGRSRFSTWACRIAYNVFADFYKKKTRRKVDSLDKILEDNPYFESNLPEVEPEGFRNLEMQDLKKVLDNTLNKLSEPHKKVLELVSYRGMNYQEIARETNCSIGTVMSRIFYARRSARKIIKRQGIRKGGNKAWG